MPSRPLLPSPLGPTPPPFLPMLYVVLDSQQKNDQTKHLIFPRKFEVCSSERFFSSSSQEGHFGWILTHFDGNRTAGPSGVGYSSQVVAVWEADLKVGRTQPPRSIIFPPRGPNHGVAKALQNCKFIISVPNPAFLNMSVSSSIPIGFNIVTPQGQVVQDLSNLNDPNKRCPGYHGSAVLKEYSLFACGEAPVDGGVLVIKYNSASKTFTSRKINYPTAGDRSGTIESHHANNYFLGNYGRSSTGFRSLLVIDPEAQSLTSSNVVSFPAAVCSFGFERKLGNKYFVHLADGTVRIMNSTSHTELASISVPEGAPCGTGVTRPARVAVGDLTLAIAAPINGSNEYVIYNYNLDSYAVRASWNVTGNVRAMTIFGLFEHFNDFPAQECDLSAPAPQASPSAAISGPSSSAITSSSATIMFVLVAVGSILALI